MGRPGEQSSLSTKRGAVPILPIQRLNRSFVVFLRPEMAGSLLPVAVAVFDERRKVLGFSGAVGSRAVTVEFARSEDQGLVLLTVPFIGRERGENSGALWRPHSGHKFEPRRAAPLSSVLSPFGARMHSSCVEMLARTRALEAVQPSALTISRPCPTLAKVPNVPFKARCLCPGTPSTKRPRPLFLFRSGTCLCAPCLAHSIQWFAPIPVGDTISRW